MNEFENAKRTIMTPVLIEAGAALIDCQGFEYGVGLLLLHFSRLGTQGLDPDSMNRIMDNEKKVTAGQLVRMLKEHIAISEELELALSDAIDARNVLIHRFMIENLDRIIDTKSRSGLLAEMKKLRSKVCKADQMLRPFIEGLGATLDGFNSKSFQEQTRKALLEVYHMQQQEDEIAK